MTGGHRLAPNTRSVQFSFLITRVDCLGLNSRSMFLKRI